MSGRDATAYIATAAPGTEDLVARELEALGARAVRRERGRVRFRGDLATALRANLGCRVAMRVLEPLAEVAAGGPEALYEAAKALPWPERLTPRCTFAVEASVRDSALTHSHFVALKVKDAVADAMRARVGARPDVDARDPDVRIVVHLARDRATIALDLSGEALFKRGYRVRKTPAPLKETLAAAVVLASGWRGEEPLCDPMCGSGTLAIEAALLAANAAPGLGRRFGVERWPTFGDAERRLLDGLREETRAAVRRVELPILASDRSAEAVAAATANARAAGVALRFAVADVRSVPALSPPGTIVTNPPYGVRLDAGRKSLKAFYWQLGQRLRTFTGHRVAVLAGHPAFESAFGARPLRAREVFNGPIACRILLYRFDRS